jgi:hypothetical protein
LDQSDLVREVDRLPSITEEDVEHLYESYRYGQQLAFYLYLLPADLAQPDHVGLQDALDELSALDEIAPVIGAATVEDCEAETAPGQIVLLDQEELNGIREIRFRYFVPRRFINVLEHPDQVLQTRYGFLWLDLSLGYLAILTRDESVCSPLIRALARSLGAIPLAVHFPKELLDKHFSIEKAKRLQYYDPGTGLRRSISGRGLWQKSGAEILARERQYARPGSLYEEVMANGVVSGLGITSTKGKIYLTKRLPTSVVRAWAIQRLPDLVRDVKELRADQPISFSRSIDAINRMRLRVAGKAAVINIVEALLKSDQDDLTSVELPLTALEIYDALVGKYFDPYLRAQCSVCDETAELCPDCEGASLEFEPDLVTCKECDATISDEKWVALRCMNGHVTSAPQATTWSIAPNHWFQKRMVRIFAELGKSWSQEDDYFHIEGNVLYRLKRGQTDLERLPPIVKNYVNNFWDLVAGQVHAGSGDIALGEQQPRGDSDASVQTDLSASVQTDLSAAVQTDLPAAVQTDLPAAVQTDLPAAVQTDLFAPSATNSRPPSPVELPPVARALSPFSTYRSFDLRLRRNGATGYTVEAAVTGGGSVPPQTLSLPDDSQFAARLRRVLRQTSHNGDTQAVGEALFRAVFPSQVLKLWENAVGGLDEGQGLRVRLLIDPAELMLPPWELIFEDEFLGLRPRFPIVRYLDLPVPPQPLAVDPPLRLLVAVSQPQDTWTLDVDAEVESIREALAPLSDKVEVDVLDPATRRELLSTLRQGYHVLHYIGHATFQDGEGYLILEDTDERSDRVSASLLGQLVADSGLRLVVLNACETAVTGPATVFSGMAHRLVKAGMPAVVAMQLAIADHSAVAFSREFYGALADGWPVDAAVQEGRRSIMIAQGNDWIRRVDWAIPTLYMRAPDGVILGVQGLAASAEALGPGRTSPAVSHSTEYHGPVYGPAHSGSGDIHVSTLDQGINATDLQGWFQALYRLVQEQAPPEKKEEALLEVAELQEAVLAPEPNLDKIHSVLQWFKTNVPQLVGAVTSVIVNPIVGKAVQAAGELAVAEIKKLFVN